MTRQFLNDKGEQVRWFPRPAGYQESEPGDGVTIRILGEETHMPKATKNTVYTLNGYRFRIKAGDELPEGAVLDEERAIEKAPENRAEKAAPQNRSAKAEKKADA